MTAQTVAQAAQEQSRDLKLINWLRAQQDDLAMAAASHLKPSTIVRVAQGALRKDPKLMSAAIANPQSLLYCLLDAARLGHEAGTDQYWLIPFGNEVTGIEGYKGVVERMFRAGGVSTVHAEIVRQRDAYRSMGSRVPPVHEYDEFADPEERGALRGVYAYAVMADGGCSQVMRMGRAEVMKHKAMSRGSDRSDSPWQKWEEPMWKKIPLSALEPYVPTSSEWLIHRARAEATAQGRPVLAPGWAPPIPAAAAADAVPQITAGTVIPDPSPAGPESPRSEPAAPPVADVAPAGEAQRDGGVLATSGQIGIIRRELARLGIGALGDDETPEQRTARLNVISRLTGRVITSTTKLTRLEASSVRQQLQGCRDAADLDGAFADMALADDPRDEAAGGE